MTKLFDKNPVLWISAILILLTLIVFAQTLGHDFVNFDDDRYVYENRYVQHGITPAAIQWAFTTGREGNWHPLTWITHMLDCQVYGIEHPGGHHFTNLLLHLASAILLFLALFRMTGFAWRSAFVAALFAVHPLHVESVAWVAERKDVLSALFWMLTLHAYISYSRRPGVLRYVAIVAAFALGLLSKPMLVSLPFVLLMLDYWPLRRFGSVPSGRLVAEKLPLLLMTAASSVITFHMQQRGGAVGATEVFPFGVRAANALVAFLTYIVKMIWPSNLTIFYIHPGHTLPAWEVIGAAAALVGASAAAIYLRRRRPYVTVGWLWFVVTLVPVIGLVQVGSQAWADRYSYIPLIGVFIAIAWWLPELVKSESPVAALVSKKAKRNSWRQEADTRSGSSGGSAWLAAAACAVVIAFTIAGAVQASYWRNSVTLWTHAVDAAPSFGNPLAEEKLGNTLEKSGELEEALEHYQRAAEIKPTFIEAHNAAGLILTKLGRFDEAVDEYKAALAAEPQSTGHNLRKTLAVHTNLGLALARLNRYHEAIPHYRQVLEYMPNNYKIRGNLGAALTFEGKTEEGLRLLKEAVDMAPDNPTVHASMGLALGRLGRMDEAIAQFKETVRLDPGYGECYNNLAVAYFNKRNYREAWRQVHLFEEHGGNPNPRFLEILSSAMPDPGE